MLFANRKDERRELFLRQFEQTARAVFVGRKDGFRRYPARILLDLARTALGYPPATPHSVIYARLAYVWRAMQKRKRSWHGNIDLAPIDLEPE